MDYMNKCREIRKEILRVVGINNVGHLGGSLSIVEILVAIYYGTHNIKISDVIMSKGHCVLPQYIILKEVYKIGDSIDTYGQFESQYQAHPTINIKTKGVTFPSGSLGQGLSGAVGMAYAMKYIEKSDGVVFVIIGDGELNEAQVTEAFDTANKYNLDNLVIIIDFNGWQLDGNTDELFLAKNYRKRLATYKFNIIECDGHDILTLIEAFKKKTKTSKVILANTVKGRGVRSLENNNDYHGSYFDYPNDYIRIMGDLENEIY